jgi:HSP20 family protein
MASNQPVPARQQGNVARASDPMRALFSDFDRTFGRFSRLFDLLDLSSEPASALGDEMVPRIDVRDKPDAVEVIAELPGVKEPDIDISVGDGALTLRAKTEEEHEEEDSGYRIHERRLGRIERVVPLQTAGLDPDNAKASFNNGLLTIRIPKTSAQSSGARRIKVEAG